MRVLGLDYGARRIGLAISDADAVIASPAGVLERRDRRRDVAALATWVREREVEHIVMGLPLHMDGRSGVEAQAVRDFAADLSHATGLQVDFVDERLTSVEAERALRDGGAGRKRRREKGAVDQVAASLILRTYLDRRQGAS
ncbi:MAG: Holliday junction resolvase RuvX [Proteobacteria bacterium]|nr:Holliday junction resolvase RuvX [Pseudomonadota bacterium]